MLSSIISPSSTFRATKLTQAQEPLHAKEESGATDAADQYGDLHINRA
nr:hypothetical protein CPGR_02330 [Mycolicibacterium malmesburyense]